MLYDIHGNLPALEAVVADARGRGVHTFLLGGDYAAFGAWPAETVAALEALNRVAMIAGNHERWLSGDAGDVPPGNVVVPGAIAFQERRLDPGALARITSLPATAEHAGTLFCHASPESDMRGFSPVDDPSDIELIGADRHRRIVFGHTHVQFTRRSAGGTELVNPGSVGLPFDGDRRAAYALIAEDGELELRRVAYDSDAAAAALRALGEPWARAVAGWLDRGRP